MPVDPKQESAMALLLYMDTIANAAKNGHPLADRYLKAEAIEIMPDGVVLYHREKFLRVMAELLAAL